MQMREGVSLISYSPCVGVSQVTNPSSACNASCLPSPCSCCCHVSDDHEHRLSVYNEVALKLVVLKPGQEPPVTLQNNLTGVHGAR